MTATEISSADVYPQPSEILGSALGNLYPYAIVSDPARKSKVENIETFTTLEIQSIFDLLIKVIIKIAVVKVATMKVVAVIIFVP